MGTLQAQIKVYNGGNVSVGSTISPVSGCRLQLIGNSVYTENTSTIESAAYIRGLNRYSTAIAPDYTWYDNLNTGIFHPGSGVIGISSNGTEVMRIAYGGNVLIGNTGNWGEKLSVSAGNQPALISYVNHQSDYMYGQCSYVNRQNSKALAVIYDNREKFKVYGNGDVWAAGQYTGSDSLLKENIVPITNALDKVLKLHGVSFNYIPDVLNDPDDTITYISTDPPKTLIGLIAEDVEPVVPEVVKTFEDGLKGIEYGNLVALLIEAIKEQQLKINELEITLSNYSNQSGSDQPSLSENNLKNSSQDNSGNNPNTPENNDDPLLFQNIPNPFNQKTSIRYYLPENSIESALLIFDMQGTLLTTVKLMNKGYNSFEISAGEFRPGMYMYSLISGGKEIDTKKMILSN
jgi:hypothetical protein